MQKPQHVTFTGLDEKTDLQRCLDLSRRYPIEWGVLVGSKTGSHPRYPNGEAITKISTYPFKKAVHLCGIVARAYQRRPVDWRQTEFFDRVQVNQRSAGYSLDALRAHSSQVNYRIIVQHRELFFPQDTVLDYLFDLSGGQGVEPGLIPSYQGENFVGFAGGIKPSNVLNWVDRIDAKNYWIDMETGVRTDDWLDLDKCELVCQQIWGGYGHG